MHHLIKQAVVVLTIIFFKEEACHDNEWVGEKIHQAKTDNLLIKYLTLFHDILVSVVIEVEEHQD